MQTGNGNIESTMMTPLILKREDVTPMEVSTNAPAPSVFKVDELLMLNVTVSPSFVSLALGFEGAVS